MAPWMVLGSSGLLLGAAVMVEVRRGPVRGVIDALRAATAVYLVCFAVMPAILTVLDWRGFESSAWNWIFARPFRDPAFAEASMLALAGYLVMVAGHGCTRSAARPLAGITPVSEERLWLVGVGLGMVGLGALVVYTASIGGVRPLLLDAAAFRGSAPPVESPLAFLRNVAPLVLGGSVAFYALRERVIGWRARLATAGFGLCLLLGGVVLFHQAGRAILAGFLVTYPLISVMRRGRVGVSLAVVVLGAGGVLFLVGKSLFQALRDPAVLARRAAYLIDQPLVSGGEMLLEFAFPVVGLANAVATVPQVEPFRWFVDLPLAVAYLAPKRLFGLDLPPTVSMVNSEQFSSFGAVPADLLSFGYYSAGPIGAMVVALAFGVLLGGIERWLPPTADPVRAALRGFWVILLAQRVMYGDPQLFWVPGFWLVVTSVALLAPRRRAAG